MYSQEYWHRRAAMVRRLAGKMKDRLDAKGRRLMRETADDCEALAKRHRGKPASKAIDQLLDAPFTKRR
jgi:hypothetical protein